MATIHYRNSDGAVAKVLSTSELESRYPAPANGESALEIDADTNAALVADLANNTPLFAVVGGVVRKSGTPQTVQPESAERTVRRELKDQINARLDEAQAVIDGVDASTNAQLRTMVKTLARSQKRILRILKGLL